MGVIFADSDMLDDLIGLGIEAGMLTAKPGEEMAAQFKKHLQGVLETYDCRSGSFTEKALATDHLEGEIARWAARETLKMCLCKCH